MAVTLPDVTFENSNEDWISLNDVTQIPVGERFTLRVKTRWGVTLIEDTSKPDIDDQRGIPVDGSDGNNEFTFEVGSLEVWAKSKPGTRIVCFTN